MQHTRIDVTSPKAPPQLLLTQKPNARRTAVAFWFLYQSCTLGTTSNQCLLSRDCDYPLTCSTCWSFCSYSSSCLSDGYWPWRSRCRRWCSVRSCWMRSARESGGAPGAGGSGGGGEPSRGPDPAPPRAASSCRCFSCSLRYCSWILCEIKQKLFHSGLSSFNEHGLHNFPILAAQPLSMFRNLNTVPKGAFDLINSVTSS